jgi:hypothetical protein
LEEWKPAFSLVGQLVSANVIDRRCANIGGFVFASFVGVFENIQSLGIGRHDAVLDVVVDHLDEMPGTMGSSVVEALGNTLKHHEGVW